MSPTPRFLGTGWSLPLYSLWATNNGPCAHHALLLELLQVLVQTAVLSVHVKVQTVSLNHKVLLDSNTEQHTYSKDSSGVNMTHTHPNTQTCMHARTHRTHTHTNTQTCTHARTHRTHTHTNTQTCTHARTHRTHTQIHMHAYTKHIHTHCMHAHTLNANNTHMLAIFLVSWVILSICSVSSVSLLR